MRIGHCQRAGTFLGILIWGSCSLIFAQNKLPEFRRPAPPNAVPPVAQKIKVEAKPLAPAVLRLAFSPDGRVLASASADQTLGLWDIKTGALLTEWKGDGRHDLGFSTDGWMLGAAGQNGSYRLWEVSSGSLLVEHEGGLNISGGTSSRFSPELDWLAIGSEQGQVHLIETATRKRLPVIAIFDKAAVGAVAYSPKRRLLAVGSGFSHGPIRPPNQVVLWDLVERKRSRELGGPLPEEGPARSDSFRRLEFSAEGNTLAAMHSRQELVLWDADQGFPWPSVPMPQGEPFALSGDGKTLARLKPSSRSQVELLEVATGGVYQTLDFEKQIGALALSPGGHFLAAGSMGSREVFLREFKSPALNESPDSEDLTRAAEWLAQRTAQQGRAGVAILIAGGDQSVAILAPHLKLDEIEARQAEEIQRLIRDLDHDDFFVRENASKELDALGQTAGPALKAELEKNPPLEVATRIQALLKRSSSAARVLSGESLRRLRAIEVLEKIGTDPARRLLQQLAKGPKSTQEAHEAAHALQRLQRTKAEQ